MALLDSPQKRLTVNEVYDWFKSRYPYFTLPRAGAWKNSVRHNLSLSKHFIKQVLPSALHPSSSHTLPIAYFN